jgi:pimeloyl-ACP methyl ester carboxylesterase
VNALALHPGVADHRVWAPLQRELGDRLRLDCPDHLALPLEALVPDEPCWVLGGSIGGRRALELQALAPDRVLGLVLVAPSVADDELQLTPEEEALGDLIDAADDAGDLDELNRLECRLWLDGATAPEGRVGGAARELFLDMNGRLLAAGLDDPPEHPLPDPASLDLPVLVVVGDLDLEHYQRLAAGLADAAPGGTLVVMDGCAHLPMLERPGRLAAAIAHLLDAVHGPR